MAHRGHLRDATLQFFRLLALIASVCLLTSSCQAKQAFGAATEQHTLKSGLGWRDCSPSRMVSVASTQEIAAVVKSAYTAALQGRPSLIRATQNSFISHNNFSCPEAAEAVESIVIDMGRMNSVIEITNSAVTVQAGITFEDLEEVLLSHQLSLPGVVIAPSTATMSVGAAVVTASHGSSLVDSAGVAGYLTKAVMVDGTGQVQFLERPGALLEGSLGLLGIVTELTFTVVPARKVAVKQLQEEDNEIVGDLKEIIENSEAVSLDVTWSPSAGLYTARVWHDAEAEAHGDAQNIFMHGHRDSLQAVNRKLLADQHDLHDEGGAMCQILGDMASSPHFSTSAGAPEGDIYGVSVGWLNRMAGMRCAKTGACFWQHAKWTPYELSINSEDFAEWVDDVRQIISNARGCPSFLFHLRFVMESDAPLAMNAGKQVVAVEIATYSGLGSTMPVKHQALFEEIVQMMLCKYSARPHWALGTSRMFLSACPLRDTIGADWEVFAASQQQYDPARLFVPRLWKAVEARAGSSFYPGCAVQGDCYCQEDSHCGPKHKCVSGRVFREYNVCMAEAWVREGDEL